MTNLGKIRGMQRVTSPDGFFLICAIDHLSDFAELLGPGRADFRDVVAAKDAVVRAVAGTVSAVLLDPLYGLGHLVASGAVPATVGVMCSIEDEDYRHPPGPRRTRLRDGWRVEDIKRTGADFGKLLWYYRPDTPVADAQRRLVRELVDTCAAVGLPLVVEPVWYPLPGEDPTDPAWQVTRIRGIVGCAAETAGLGVDLLKVEFPGYLDTAEGRRSAAAACAELDAAVPVPWVLLSAGVGYPEFRTQLEIACRAGASGYLAGRSIWRDAVSTRVPAAFDEARNRLAELNAITRSSGRPCSPSVPLDEALAKLPAGWYLTADGPGYR
jgi:tagatose-1,6-bisphosphate aldolase